MNGNKPTRENMVCLPHNEFENLLEQAACRNARKALAEVGLADEETAEDIRNLRDLVGTIKLVQRTFLQTLIHWLTIGLLAFLTAGIAVKSGHLAIMIVL